MLGERAQQRREGSRIEAHIVHQIEMLRLNGFAGHVGHERFAIQEGHEGHYGYDGQANLTSYEWHEGHEGQKTRSHAGYESNVSQKGLEKASRQSPSLPGHCKEGPTDTKFEKGVRHI